MGGLAGLERKVFIDRRSKAEDNEVGRRTEFLSRLGGLVVLSTSFRKTRRIREWFNEVKQLGSGELGVPIHCIKVEVDEPDFVDSESLGVVKELKQIEKANTIPDNRDLFRELEAKGNRFVLIASCDVNTSAEDWGGGNRKGVRKDPHQDQWSKKDFEKNIGREFTQWSQDGITVQPDRVDVLSLATQYMMKSSCGSNKVEALPSVHLPPFTRLENTWETRHVDQKVNFAAEFLLGLGLEVDLPILPWAQAIAQLSHETAGPVGSALTNSLDRLRAWVDCQRIGPGVNLATTKGWKESLPKNVILHVNQRTPDWGVRLSKNKIGG